jgi:ATP adenylyltransferase
MEHIWSPWRYQYISTADRQPGCVFCRFPGEQRDAENYIVHRAAANFVILNLFPYTSGHLMIVPYAHIGSLAGLEKATTGEMIELAKVAQSALEAEYHPDGFNIGMNLGRSAGAGIAEHLHLHVVPRWVGDANFVSVVGETRVLPEDLRTTYEKLSRRFSELL